MKNQPITHACMQSLEERRLLSLNPFGPTDPANLGTKSFSPLGEVGSGMAADGSYIVAATFINGHGSQVAAVRFAANGDQIGQRIVLDTVDRNTDDDGMVRFDAIASNSADDSVITYDHEISNVPDSIFVVRISHDGTVSSPQQLTDGGNAVTSFGTQLAIDSAGDYFVGYITGTFDTGMNYRIASFNPDGSVRSAPFTADSTNTSIILSQPIIAAKLDGSGVDYAFYSNQEDNDDNVFHLHFGMTNLNSTLHQGSNSQNVMTFAPVIVAQKNGAFTIAYRQINADLVTLKSQPVESFLQRFDSSANLIGTPVQLAADSRAEQADVTGLSPDSNGGVYITFATIHGSSHALYIQDYTSDLAIQTSPILIDSGFIYRQNIVVSNSVGVDANGAAVVSYFNVGNPNGPGNIFVRHFTPQIVAVNGTTLFAFGDVDNNIIRVAPNHNSIRVTVGNTVRSFDASTIEQLSIDGQAGNDSITNATALRSTIFGGDGNDTIDGGINADSIFGGNGNDRITANAGNDTIYGEAGDDQLFGNSGNDRLIGGNGADTLNGGPGTDSSDSDPLDQRVSIEKFA